MGLSQAVRAGRQQEVEIQVKQEPPGYNRLLTLVKAATGMARHRIKIIQLRQEIAS
jgi:hypothetical protein